MRSIVSRTAMSAPFLPNHLPLTTVLVWLSHGFAFTALADDKGIEFFESRIRPALVQHCYECHSSSSKEVAGGLLLDSREGVSNGGDSGPAVLVSDAKKSLMLNALRYQDLKMPPSKKLPEDVIEAFEKWIAMGTPDPRDGPSLKPKTDSIDWKAAKQFWSFRPRQSVQVPPAVQTWVRNPIDTFIAEKHSAIGVVPVPQADRSTWLRRVYLDLIGIPPKAESVDAFLFDDANDAYEKVVDRLLASPDYGQRWGRYWLDLARYADSNGADENHGYPVAWRYRDYAIDSFNDDVPFDRFVVEQLAGDLLVAQDEADQRRLITATGFLVIGPKMLAEQDKPKLVADLVDEQVDTIGKVFLGLTIGCARCHDHKFDPILASDYYSLAGIMHSTKSMEHLNFVSQWNERELPDALQSKKMLEYQQASEKPKAELNSLRRRFQEQTLMRQLHSMLAAMHLLASNVESSSSTQVQNPASLEKWLSILQQDTSTKRNQVFSAWHKLKSIGVDTFAEDAQSFWKELASRDSNSKDWNSRLAGLSAPKTKLELIGHYEAVMSQSFTEILDAKRTAEGKIEAAETLKLSKQLFEGNGYFVSLDKLEESLSENDKKVYLTKKEEVDALEKTKPIIAKAMAAQEGEVRLVALNVRGNHLQTAGPPLERNVPKVFRDEFEKSQLDIPRGSSGRLELAKWIIHESNPLTARVFVNRVWQGHFGQGLVSSGSNFGFRGELPSHPELLDWLANEFVAHDWSLKWLHREIVLSGTYRFSSNPNASSDTKDPGNRWLWRQNKHRMEAEVLRDSLLSIGDALSLNFGGGPQNASSPTSQNIEGAKNIGNMRRTVYLEVNRAALSDYLSTFDYVEPGVSVDHRSSTIVPHQSLYLMNHPMPQEIGKQLATRLHAAAKNDAERFELASKSILGRSPNNDDCTSLIRFLNPSNPSDASLTTMNSTVDQWIRVCRSLLLTNEFIYVE